MLFLIISSLYNSISLSVILSAEYESAIFKLSSLILFSFSLSFITSKTLFANSSMFSDVKYPFIPSCIVSEAPQAETAIIGRPVPLSG